MSTNLPLALRTSLEAGNAVLFLGAGIGFSAFRDGLPMPTATSLASDLASKFNIDTEGSTDLAKIARVVELRKGRPELIAFLTDRLCGFQPNDPLCWLLSLTWRAIFTTNFDDVIQRAYALSAHPTQTPVTISSTASLRTADHRFEIPIYHLHGALYHVDDPNVLITEEDYARFSERRRMLFEILKHELAASTVLYVGYSHDDENWRIVLSDIAREFAPSPMPQAFRVAPATPALNREILRSQRIETIDATLDAFVDAARSLLGDLRVEPRSVDTLKRDAPRDLHTHLETNTASTTRLLGSWTYVNQAPFDEDPNTQAFLCGERCNWGALARDVPFARDIEEPVFDELADFATEPRPKFRCFLILGPAGYGVSTALLRLAARIAREKAGRVFFHRTGLPLRPADIEFATTLFSERLFIFVDNAADNVRDIELCRQRLRDLRKPVCFVLGERINEWRLTHSVIASREFQLEALSDPEITRLLRCLESHDALGELGRLDVGLQFAAIKEKHDRQLLVAMRETIENNSFDAIIESEYRDLGNDTARYMYAIVSCGYQLRRHIRDELLAKVIGLTLVELYQKTRDAIEGVIEFDTLDPSTGAQGARCRHHAIAEIVWNRCVSLDERRDVLLSLMRHSNLQYYSDWQLFDYLIRSERDIDAIPALDSKMTFFETACRKAPDNGYVRQHFARMLVREKKYESALQQIDAALQHSPSTAIFHHTKGVVLRELAMATESLDLARRHFVKSEAEFEFVINKRKRDPYGYQSLAELYLGWAKRLEGNEASDYLAKCEETIRRGMKHVRQREALHIVSASLEAHCGNDPKAVRLLTAAAQSNPVARYLLAKGQLDSDPIAAMKTLKPALENDPREPQTAMLYARALLAAGDTLKEAIAVLRLADLFGLRDPRYVAFLGGLLFMDGQFSDAEATFRQTEKHRFAIEEQQRIHYWPSERGNPRTRVRLAGSVVSVKPGYCWVQVPGYPLIFCPGTKYDRIIMKTSVQITFEPGFNARGPVVTSPVKS